MREAFRQHHHLSEAEQTAIWDDATFVFDTNVLLNVYRYADSTREDLLRVMRAVTPRIHVPHQVAKEFYRHRIDVILEQSDKYVELENQLDKFLATIRSSFHRNAFLRIADIETQLRPALESARTLVSTRRQAHPDLLHNDTYLEQLTTIIGSSIGAELDQAALDKRHAEAQSRLDRQVPPGNRDAKKPPPERFGDVLIWFELLDFAESSRKPIILVTDDDKDDWWHIVRGQKLGPRPELREEMRRRAAVEFHIYSAARFLEKVGRELQVNVSKNSIDDASRIADELKEDALVGKADLDSGVTAPTERPTPSHDRQSTVALLPLRVRASKAVARWIERTFPYAQLHRVQGSGLDYLIVAGTDLLGVSLLVARDLTAMSFRAEVLNSFLEGHYELAHKRITSHLVVIVTPKRQSRRAVRAFMSGIAAVAPRSPVRTGFIDDTGHFVEVPTESALDKLADLYRKPTEDGG